MFAAFLPLVLASTVLAVLLPREGKRRYDIYNRCPTPIDLYITGAKQESIPTDGSVTKTLGTGAGPFYTTANGGSENGDGTIRAGFHEDYYYIISDPDHANTGLQVKPSNPACEQIRCDGRGCPQAFPEAPTTFPDPPPVALHRCPDVTDYELMFCPTGQFANQGQPIHFNHLPNKCLGVPDGVFTNGTPVQVYDCNGTQAQQWIITRGSTKVHIAGSGICLDAGSNPANGVQLKISPCQDKNPAQQWVYTDKDRIIMTLGGKDSCIDLENGNTTAGSNKVQIGECGPDNDNQVWNI